ncbi:unnamed protein product, partial [Prorocentrum cordatum]
MYKNTCLCGAPFSNLPPPETGGGGTKPSKGKGKGKGQDQAALEAQLESVIKDRGGTEQAKAAQALLDATRAAGKKAESSQPITQQVTAAASKVQKAQTAFDKAQSQQLKLTMELEKCKSALQNAATTLARAEAERATLFRSMVPTVAAAGAQQAAAPNNTIDLSALLSAQSVDDSLFTLSLGEEFSNADGLLEQSDVEELDRRKKAVMEALMHTLKATFGDAHEKLKEHRENLSEIREKMAKRRRENSPGPPPTVASGGPGSAAAASGGSAAGQAAGQPAAGAAAAGSAPGGAAADADAVEAARLTAIETKLKSDAEAMLATARGEPASYESEFGPYMFIYATLSVHEKPGRKAGYIGMLSAAYEFNGKSKADGITMGTLKKFKVQSMRHLASAPSDQVGLRDLDRSPKDQPGIDFRDMVAMQLRAQGQSLLIVGVYMTSSVGPKANAPKLANVGTLVSTVQGPWLAIGDWNMTPKELAGTGWLSLVTGSVIAPFNTDYTCTLGSGRMLDYMVVSQHAMPWVESLLADFQAVEGAGKAHYGLQLSLNFDASRARAWPMRMPRAFPHPARPKLKADPASKRSQKKVEAQAWRDARPQPAVAPAPPSWGPRRKLVIKSPPPLQYSLFGEDEDEFFTDGEGADVSGEEDDVQVAVSDSDVDTHASIQAEWSSEAK